LKERSQTLKLHAVFVYIFSADVFAGRQVLLLLLLLLLLKTQNPFGVFALRVSLSLSTRRRLLSGGPLQGP
jgi:hypothetical protein